MFRAPGHESVELSLPLGGSCGVGYHSHNLVPFGVAGLESEEQS